MNKAFKRKAAFYKFLISYCLAFSLPVCFLLLYFYPHGASIIKQNAIDNDRAVLAQTADHLDVQLKHVRNYPDAIHKNRNLNSQVFTGENPFFNGYLIMHEMRQLFGYSSFLERAVLYNRSNGMFYTTTGSFTYESAMESGFSFEYVDWDKEEMIAELNGLSEMKMRAQEPIVVRSSAAGRVQEALTIMMPVPYANERAYAVLMLVIPKEGLFPFLSRQHLDRNMLIMGVDGSLLASYQNDPAMTDAGLVKHLHEGYAELEGQLDVGGRTYIVNKTESAIYNLRIVSFTPLDDVLANINRLQRTMLLIVLGILIAEALLIIVFMRTNYAPIHRMRKRALAIIDTEPAIEMNEIETVDFAFDSLRNENRELVNQMMLNKNIATEYFLIQCLNGSLDKEEDWLALAEEQGIVLGSHVCCFTFYSATRDILSLLVALNGLADAVKVESKARYYLVKGMRHEDFICLAAFDHEDEMKQYVYRLHHLDSAIKVGMGSIEPLKQTNNSYSLSLAALETAMHREGQSLAVYDEVDIGHLELMKQIFEQIRLMDISISRGDAGQLELHFNKLLDMTDKKAIRLFIFKVIYLNVHNVLVKALGKYGHHEHFAYSIPEKDMDTEKLKERLTGMVIAVTREMDNDKAKSPSVDIMAILSYIERHYRDETLSMQTVADAFGMSYSNFSHYFKKQTGVNFASHLERLRINQAKRLLEESEASVKDIAAQVGYTNTNSFSRAFKKLESLSPGEYRQQAMRE